MVVADGKRCNLEIGKKGNKLPDCAWPAYCPLPVMHCTSLQNNLNTIVGALLKSYMHNFNTCFYFSGTFGLSGAASTSSSTKMLSLDHHQQVGRVDIFMVCPQSHQYINNNNEWQVPFDVTLNWID